MEHQFFPKIDENNSWKNHCMSLVCHLIHKLGKKRKEVGKV